MINFGADDCFSLDDVCHLSSPTSWSVVVLCIILSTLCVLCVSVSAVFTDLRLLIEATFHAK